MPKKMRQAAMRSGLSSRMREGAIMALDAFTVEAPKTRTMAAALDALELAGRVLIIDTEFEDNAVLATRNLRNVEMQTAHSLNLLEVLGADTLVVTVPALQALAERLSNGTR
jgi:large subunit ribosomal protein L4